jgi:hypothetical protein
VQQPESHDSAPVAVVKAVGWLLFGAAVPAWFLFVYLLGIGTGLAVGDSTFNLRDALLIGLTAGAAWGLLPLALVVWASLLTRGRLLAPWAIRNGCLPACLVVFVLVSGACTGLALTPK